MEFQLAHFSLLRIGEAPLIDHIFPLFKSLNWRIPRYFVIVFYVDFLLLSHYLIFALWILYFHDHDEIVRE